MGRFLLLANGPGEVWGWARPLIFEMLRRSHKPEICLLPCQYASGRERYALEERFPRGLFFVSPGRLLRGIPRGAYQGVLQLGGDLLYGRYAAWRVGCPLFCYTYGWKKGLKHCALVGTAFPFMARGLEAGGVSSVVTGDLVRDALDMDGLEEPPFSWGNGRGARVAFFPGSREHIRTAALPYAEAFRRALGERMPQSEITVLLSPFSRGEEWSLWESRGFRTVHRNTRGVLQEADWAVTQPGTNTLELMHTETPGIVAVPGEFFKYIPLPGILAPLEKIPPLASRVRAAGLRRLTRRYRVPGRYLAWPNRLGEREILPERVGEYAPGDLARETAEFLLDRERRRVMARHLRALSRGVPENPAVRIVDAMEEHPHEVSDS